MTKRAVLYARVSGDDTGKDGRNLTGQLEMAREFAEKHCWSVVGELAEDERGVSGARMDAPELNRALSMARDGQFDVLIVRELDRLARGLVKQLIVEEEFRRAGVQIEYVLGEYAATPEGQLSKQIRAVIAEYEREKIRERSLRGRRQSVRAGNVLTHGRPPFGYNFTRENGQGRLEVNEDEAVTIRMIFDIYSTGATIKELADAMRGIPTPSDRREYPGLTNRKRSPGEWNSRTLNHILDNTTYSGVFRYGGLDAGEPITVSVPAVISPDVWSVVHKRRDRNKKRVAGYTRRHKYLLVGRGRCGSCGLSINSYPATKKRNGSTRLYYRCPSFNTTRHIEKCDLPNFSAAVTDEKVWSKLREFLTEPASLERGAKRYMESRERLNEPIERQLAVVDGLIREHEEKLSRLIDLYLSGEFERAALSDRKQQLEHALTGLKNRYDELSRSLGPTFSADDIAVVQKLVGRLGERIKAADGDFAYRRQLIDLLDVQATFTVEDGERVIYLSCAFGQMGVLSVDTDSSRRGHLAI